MPLNNSLRGQTTQDHILTSIVERLISQFDELDESNCWLTDQPIPISIPGGRLAVTVSLGPGRFPAEFFAGGGADTLVEDGSLVITPLVVTPADRPRRKWRKIMGAERAGDAPSLLYIKHGILKALLADPDWEPDDGDKPLLRDMLSPLSCDDPHDVPVGETVATAMRMRFSIVFDWDLSGAIL